MINVRRSLRRGGRGVDINMGPLIDMVFLLLIFFVVTTSFVKETGIDVERPAAATAELKEQGNVLIGVPKTEGSIWIGNGSMCAACGPTWLGSLPRTPKARW
jgi:biopolymer transport protein ExbD